MATDFQVQCAKLGGGNSTMNAAVTLTMVAGAAVTGTFTPPAGSRVSAMRAHTGVTFTGSPTNINLTVGKTAGAAEYVAATDIKTANAPAALTLVAAPDYSSWPAGQALNYTLTAVGGTNPAGTCVVTMSYDPLTALA